MGKRQKKEEVYEGSSESEIEEEEAQTDSNEPDGKEVMKRWKAMNRGRKGECKICSKPIPKSSAATHLVECLDSDDETAKPYHLFKIESGDYFLYVAVRPNITLKEMDDWIRLQWLECCGHLSSFRITMPKKKKRSIDFLVCIVSPLKN